MIRVLPSIFLRRVAALALLGSATACTLLMQRDEVQCTLDADCVTKLGFKTAPLCSKEGVCVAGTVTGLPNGGGEACTLHKDCSSVQSGVGRCVDGACVDLVNADCKDVYGVDALYEEGSILLGLLAPTTSTFTGLVTSPGEQMKNAVRLAVDEYNTSAKDYGQQDVRQVGVVVCDEMADVGRATDTLVNTMHVRGVIGPFDDQKLIDMKKTAIDKRLPVVAPFANAKQIEGLTETQGLIVSLSPNRERLVPLFNQLLEEVKKHPFFTSVPTPVATATLYSKDIAARELFLSLASEDVNALPSDTGVSFEYLLTSKDNYADVANRLLGLSPRPRLIVSLGSGLLDTSEVFYKIEATTEVQNNAALQPFYLAFQRSTSLLFTAAANLSKYSSDGSGPRPALERMLVFDFERSAEVEAIRTAFASAYRNSAANVRPAYSTELAYDSFYVLAYALHAARGDKGVAPEAVDAAGFVAGLKRISGGEDAPKRSINDTKEILRLLPSGAVNLVGASGELDFDTNKGSPVAPVQVWCVRESTLTPGTAEYVATSLRLRLSPENNVDVSGTIECDP